MSALDEAFQNLQGKVGDVGNIFLDIVKRPFQTNITSPLPRTLQLDEGVREYIQRNQAFEADAQRRAKITPTPTIIPIPTQSAFAEAVTQSKIQQQYPTPTPNQTGTIPARNPSIAKLQIQKYTPAISAIRQAAQTYNVPEGLLLDIAFAESSLDPKQENRTKEGIKAGIPIGLFQFTPNTWETVKRYAAMPGTSLKLPNLDPYDPVTNALAAAFLIKFGQLSRWNASQWNWGKYYNPEELQGYYAQTLSRR